jgi:hypothetical protein
MNIHFLTYCLTIVQKKEKGLNEKHQKKVNVGFQYLLQKLHLS